MFPYHHDLHPDEASPTTLRSEMAESPGLQNVNTTQGINDINRDSWLFIYILFGKANKKSMASLFSVLRVNSYDVICLGLIHGEGEGVH